MGVRRGDTMAGGMAGAGVEQMIEASVLAAARAMEDKVDEEIERLDKVRSPAPHVPRCHEEHTVSCVLIHGLQCHTL